MSDDDGLDGLADEWESEQPLRDDPGLGEQDHNLPFELRREGGKELYPVPVTSHGDMITSLVATVDALNAGSSASKLEHIWLGASFCTYLLTMTTQFVLSFALMATSVDRAADPYEGGRSEEMTAALHGAVVAGLPLRDGSRALALCERSDVNFVPAYFLILMIWVMYMTDELSQGAWLLAVTQKVPLLGQSYDESDDSGQEWDESQPSARSQGSQRLIRETTRFGINWHQIQYMTPRLRHLCFWVSMSRLVITAWVLWVGTVFLIFALETQVLVLKSLVCSFFIHIGDLLFKWLSAEPKLNRLRRTSFCFHSFKSEDWGFYGSTWVRFCIVVAVTSVIWFCIFHSLREFRYSCMEYKAAFPRRNDHEPHMSLQWEWVFH